MAEFILGVDGGGSKTVAVLADRQGNELGRGISGPSNFQVVGVEQAQLALRLAIQNAFIQAGIAPQAARLICLGMAGMGREEDRGWLRQWCLMQQTADRVEVMTDAELLLWAGTPAGWGLGCVSGTGSIAFGVDSTGKKARAGGWGFILGDEGSGYAIGQAALRAAVRAADGRGSATTLTQRILHAWNLKEAAGLISVVYRGTAAREQISQLTEIVAEEAGRGDWIAARIMEDAALELSAAVVAVARQLAFSRPIPCALGGGVLVYQPGLAERVVSLTCEAGVTLEPVAIVKEPVKGAIRYAMSQSNYRA